MGFSQGSVLRFSRCFFNNQSPNKNHATSSTQIVTKLKNQNFVKTQTLTKLKTQNVTNRKNSKCEKLKNSNDENYV